MNTENTTSPTVAEIERDVEARSAVFKKELGLFDLVLTQVVFVVGTFWVGWAARLGHEQSVFWILAIVTFYLPLAAAVIFLNRLMPSRAVFISGPSWLSTISSRSWSAGTSGSLPSRFWPAPD